MIRDIIRNTTAAEWFGNVLGALSVAGIMGMALMFAPVLPELMQ